MADQDGVPLRLTVHFLSDFEQDQVKSRRGHDHPCQSPDPELADRLDELDDVALADLHHHRP